MRKFVLAIVVALIGVSHSVPSTQAADISIRFVNNETPKVALQIDNFDTSTEITVLICEIASLDCNYGNIGNQSNRVRYECFNNSGTNSCETFPNSGPISISLFEYSSWIGQTSLPNGTYEIKVIVDRGGVYLDPLIYPFIEIFSNTLFDVSYTVAPSFRGDPYVGSTLELVMPTWTLEPDDTIIQWLRCKKAVAAYSIRMDQAPPYTTGREFVNDELCAYLNEDGSLVPSIGLVSVQKVTSSATSGFLQYRLTEADIGYYIAVQIEGFRDIGAGSKYIGVASTSVVVKKTVPVNQTTPSATFTKTKKFKKLTVGAQVSATPGTWKWANTTTYQWFACTKRQKSATSIDTKQCKSIKRATKANYKVKKTDKGRFLVAQVTATNEVGSTVIYATSLKKIS